MVYNDLASLDRLKAQSKSSPNAALDEAAKQFEALFMTMMLKAMRDTLPEDGMFNSSHMRSYQEMFDQQLALDLSRKSGIGLSDLIAKQLSGGILPDKGTAETDQPDAMANVNAVSATGQAEVNVSDEPHILTSADLMLRR